MKGISWLLCVVFTLGVSWQVWADQEVILKSGTRMIGAVTIDGADAVVTMADDKVRVPLKDVATIAAENSSPERQAQRLLFTALEARLLNGKGNEAVGLLAEAKRLAPEDPSVAYWCASTLVDAGYGKAANEVFAPRREAIAKAYPGLADQLAARIKRRADMEKMPMELVKRLDELNAAASHQSPSAEKRQMFATFRVVDQHKQPIDQSAFRIESRGDEDNVESFDDGYYVLTFGRHRYNRDEPCRLEVVQAGFESKSFPFSAATNRVADVGEFVISRLDESSKRPYRVQVVDSNGKPIAGAKVALQTTTSQRSSGSEAASTTTDLDGRADLLVFPMKYSYSVSADGFNYQSGNVEVPAGDRAIEEQNVKMHRAIQSKIRVAWLSTGVGNAGGGATTSGEAEIRATGSAVRANQFGPDSINWIRTIQQQDRLILQFINQPFGGPPQFGSINWVRVVEPEVEKSDSDSKHKGQEKFDAIDLKKISELKDKIAPPKSINPVGAPGSYPGSVSVRAELGKVYVGKLMQRDMRTGQPVELSFKAIVDEMSSDGDLAE
jgi:hypothetical protein